MCGSGMEELFRATTLEKFVVLQKSGGAEIEETGLKAVMKPWTDKVTVLPMTAEKRGGKWQNIDALLIRPDMRIAWVARSELPMAEIQSSFAAALEYWFGHQG